MLLRPTLRLLLLLTFSVGQWLAVVHATQHELTAADTLVACETCLLGHGSGGMPSMPILPADLSSRAAPPPAPRLAALPDLRAARPRSRAPPSSLA